MRVICIDDKCRPEEFNNGKNVVEGNVYTVIETCYGQNKLLKRVMAYRFAEITKADNPQNLFACDRFIPLSQIDETEFERNYKKELV